MALLSAGTAAPEIDAENLMGGPVKLADHKGKRQVVLVFPPPNVDPKRINATNTLYKKIRDNVEIIAVQKSLPSKQMAKMFLQQMGVQFPVLLDKAGAAFEAYGVEKPPATFYINVDGEIVASSTTADVDQIEAEVNQHLL